MLLAPTFRTAEFCHVEEIQVPSMSGRRRGRVCLKERLWGAIGVRSVHGTEGATCKKQRSSLSHPQAIRSAWLLS